MRSDISIAWPIEESKERREGDEDDGDDGGAEADGDDDRDVTRCGTQTSSNSLQAITDILSPF